MRRVPLRFLPGVTLPTPAPAPVPVPARRFLLALPVLLVLLALLACLPQAALAGAEATSLRLTPRERAARPDLARQEDALAALVTKVQARKTRLAALRAEGDRLGRERQALAEKSRSLTRRTTAMLPDLWVLSVQARAGMEAGAWPWDEADRRFTWLTATFAQARQELEATQAALEALDRDRLRQEGLEAEIEAQSQALAKPLSDLLAARYALLKSLETLRQDQAEGDAQLRRIFALLADLDFPVPAGSPPLAGRKGALPWPARGRLVAGFAPQNGATAPSQAAPQAAPQGLAPSNGVGLAVDEATPAQAVHPGTLAFSDAVSGLGQVVIVAHGHSLFSVYTHLSRGLQPVGQGVTTGETLGAPGIYPPAHGSGLSFELRFREKPFNPTEWLTARQ